MKHLIPLLLFLSPIALFSQVNVSNKNAIDSVTNQINNPTYVEVTYPFASIVTLPPPQSGNNRIIKTTVSSEFTINGIGFPANGTAQVFEILNMSDYPIEFIANSVSAQADEYKIYGTDNIICAPGKSVKALYVDSISRWVILGGDAPDVPIEFPLPISGRFDLFTDGRWVTSSDAVFGLNQQDWDLTGGTGVTPNIDWDGLGIYFKAGTTATGMDFICRANNNEVVDLNGYVRVHDTDLTAGLATDSNGEIGAVEVMGVTALNVSNGGPGVSNDIHSFSIPMSEYTFNNNGTLHLFVQPSTVLGTARQYRCTGVVWIRLQ